MNRERRIIIVAGPNGAGKTTFAREFLPREADCPIFINRQLADTWALYDNAGATPVLLELEERK